eukprot:6477365-Amphidinium_carterae.1
MEQEGASWKLALLALHHLTAAALSRVTWPQVYWSLNVPMNFCTAVLRDGELIYNPLIVAKPDA